MANPKRRPKHSKTKKSNKRATNLTIDAEAVARGERFGELHRTSLSQLVTRFLYSLPSGEEGGEIAGLTAPVRRLYGAAAGGKADRAAYRAHLVEKYGKR